MALQKNVKRKANSEAKAKTKLPILKSDDLPVTQGMLTAVRRQIKSSINSLEKKQDARFNQIESKMELVLSEMHRMTILMEEQNSRNRFVLDSYASLSDRQDRIDLRFDTHENEIEKFILKRTESIK